MFFAFLKVKFFSLGKLFGIFSVVLDNFSMIAPLRSLNMESDFFINHLWQLCAHKGFMTCSTFASAKSEKGVSTAVERQE